MKINPKVFRNLTSEPFEVQNIGDYKVSFYDMNTTSYLTQFAGRGKFAIWTSDGSKEYKVLIEMSYYEALKPFYEYDVNKIWLEFLSGAGEISKKINLYFMIPTVSLYLVVAVVAAIFFPTIMIQILLALLAIVFISNMIQTRFTSKKIKEENIKSQDKIKQVLGQDEFDQLVIAQEVHYKNYFKFEDSESETKDENIDIQDVDAETVENKTDKEKE